jgi:hypothetical protein
MLSSLDQLDPSRFEITANLKAVAEAARALAELK